MEITEQNGVFLHRLSYALPILTEPMRQTYSVSFAVWFLQGSRDESPEEVGIAHFLEHMFFKGTRRRTVQDIARLLDRVGGRVDAFTTKEYVCFYARVLHEHLPTIVELFADLLTDPLFDPEEFERERSIILEELRGVDDDPGEFAYERFLESFWPDHGLGRPIGGTLHQVLAIRRDQLIRFFHRQVFPENMLITAIGAVDPEELSYLVDAQFQTIRGRHGVRPERTAPGYTPFAEYWHRPGMEQAHVILGGPGLSLQDPRRHAYALLVNILGGGMSSRLFMKIREERGLAYMVHASIMPFSDTGLWYVHVATAPPRLPELMDVLRAELERICREPVTPEELTLAKEQARASLLMSWENPNDRMFTRAKQFIYAEPFRTIEDRIAELRSIPIDALSEVARVVFRPDAWSCLVLGDVPDDVLHRIAWNRAFTCRVWQPVSVSLRA